MKRVEIYSDGSCLRNPGPGGWACILKYKDVEKLIKGGVRWTTNNRMELLAAVNGLEELKYPCEVILMSDSKYLLDAFNKGWIKNWERQGFLLRKNGDLWERLWNLSHYHKIEFKWIKGHNGDHYNEICDREARTEASLV